MLIRDHSPEFAASLFFDLPAYRSGQKEKGDHFSVIALD
jgi:hypothetical protein